MKFKVFLLRKKNVTYDLFEKIDIFLLPNGVSVADFQNSFIDILFFVTILLDAPNESKKFSKLKENIYLGYKEKNIDNIYLIKKNIDFFLYKIYNECYITFTQRVVTQIFISH